MTNYDIDYLKLVGDIHYKGVDVYNERTGKNTRTLINADITYDVDLGEFPLLSVRKCYWKAAIAELIGYMRGYDNAADFRAIGCNTWNANANENEAWLNNMNRRGPDDMGAVYGVQGRRWTNKYGQQYDQLMKVID